MAQAEDTELRDLVIEALEKNGSLAKIRALLRANIFLAFENECENIKQNVNLDNILNIPEGILCLSVIHEFLEFCNLKNTLFVYKSESRQGKEYSYEGQKILFDKFNLVKHDSMKEPILLTLIKTLLKLCQRKNIDQNDTSNHTKAPEKGYDNAFKDDQNCTYIVHEDSSITTSNSQSDNSSDEKNKLHLRLHLDNSDTDTSSDSTRGKNSSEYIPNEHVVDPEKDNEKKVYESQNHDNCIKQNENLIISSKQENIPIYYLNELKIGNNSSSDSTSYVELKPFSSVDEKLLNTTGVPIIEDTEGKLTNSLELRSPDATINKDVNCPNADTTFTATQSSSSLLKNENYKNSIISEKKLIEESGKSDGDTGEYSFDFSSPSSKKDTIEKPHQSPDSVREDLNNHSNKNSSNDGHIQNSASSQSSVSISDVADLLSEKSFSFGPANIDLNEPDDKKSKLSSSIGAKKSLRNDDDSGDFSESPVPSLSNLSLEVHSD